MRFLKAHGRFVVAAVALAVAFVLSVQFSDRGVQFDLHNTSVSASEKQPGQYDLASLKILNRVLLQIKDNYVEPDRIDPNKMLVYALDEIQNSIAEVVVDFDKDKDDHPTTVKLSVNGKSKTFKIGNIESLWEMSFRLREMFRFVQDNLDPDTDVEYRQVEYAAINGMLETLDPHSTLLPPKHYEEMQTETGGKFGGLGIVISIPRDGKLTVISPIDGTPAARAGIKAKDHIVRIGEESTINMQLTEAVNLLRGDPGTKVTLWIQRKGWNEPHKFVVERAIIKIDSVDSKPLKDKIGYVRIKNFQANTFHDLKTHLGKLKSKMGGLQGLVIDLRDNPGGLLDQAIKVSDLFLTQGTIVSTVGVGNRLREKREAKKSGTEPDYPIIVLVNAGSASASEIVSGALQNHNRALIVGDTTFGKGSVQVLYEFPDNSALKLTIAQYLTPGGISIQSKGITPDLRTIPVTINKDDVDMFLSRNVLRERDLSSHLTSNAVRKGAQKSQYIRFVRKETKQDDEFRNPDEVREDFEMNLAQRMLANMGGVSNRTKMLAKVHPVLEKIAADQFKTIKHDLRKLGVDWSRGPSQKTANLDVKIATDPATGAVKAGDKLSVTATVTNRGSKTLYQLKAISESDNSILDDREFPFGKIAPGQTKKFTITAAVPKDMPTREDVLKLHFSDPSDEYESTKGSEVTLNVLGNDRPKFGFSYSIADSSGDGVLSPGESVKLHILVRNVGRADSAETRIFLKNLAKDAIYLKKGRAQVDAIKKGAEAPFDFEFDVKQAPKDKDGKAEKTIDLQLDIFDMTYREFTEKKLSIPFAAKSATVAKASGSATVTAPTKLFVAADTSAALAATAGKNAVLPVDGKVGGWLRVNLGNREAFVQAKQVKTDTAKAKLAGLTRDIMFQPPTIDLKTPTLMTSSHKVKLDGKARDDGGVKDYFIFVYNRDNLKLNAKKLEYVRTRGHGDVQIAANVPLFKGMNRIAVVARDEEGMTTTESTYVYRK